MLTGAAAAAAALFCLRQRRRFRGHRSFHGCRLFRRGARRFPGRTASLSGAGDPNFNIYAMKEAEKFYQVATTSISR